MTQPSLPTVKALFARSKNRCAFPGCSALLVEASGTVIGEICHIRAEKSRGPRYDKTFPADRRNASENLILLCGCHHKVVDTDTRTYKTEILLRMKLDHEERGLIEISSDVAVAAQALLAHYNSVGINNNSGQIAVNSPGAILAGVVNITSNRTRMVASAPVGSIGASQPMSAYCKYLIARYNEYQKADLTGKSSYKYMALPNAVMRKYGNRWQDLPESAFSEIVAFLKARIDATVLGRRNRSRSFPNYHEFHDHGR